MQKYIEVDEAFLRQKYIIDKLKIQGVADLMGHSYSLVRTRFKEFNIPTNPKRIWSKYHLNEQTFKECDSPEKAYWIGFIMADGYVSIGKLEIELNKKDIEILKGIRTFLRANNPIRPTRQNKVRLRIFSRQLVKDLNKYGIVQRKTGKEQIKNIPKQYYPDFIRGYFDGDGCIDIKNTGYKMFKICSANEGFLRKIQGILIKNCVVTKNKICKSNHGNVWQLGYCGNQIIKRIFNYLYGDAELFLERKYQKWIQ